MLNEFLKDETKYLYPMQYYCKNFTPHFEMPMHSHKYIEIMYAESGSFEFEASKNSVVEKRTIIAGQFVIIDSLVPHKLSLIETAKIYNIEFTAQDIKGNIQNSFFKYFEQSNSLNQFLGQFNSYNVINDTENILGAIKRLHLTTIKSNDGVESFINIQSLVLNFFIDLSQCYLNTLYHTQSIYVTKTLNIIHNNLNASLNPQRLAATLRVSESYLHRQFKFNIGTSIGTYISNLRIEKAKQLLVNSTLSVIDIAVEVGFNTRQNFNLVFAKSVQMSPNEFRKKNKDNKEYGFATNPIEQNFFN